MYEIQVRNFFCEFVSIIAIVWVLNLLCGCNHTILQHDNLLSYCKFCIFTHPIILNFKFDMKTTWILCKVFFAREVHLSPNFMTRLGYSYMYLCSWSRWSNTSWVYKRPPETPHRHQLSLSQYSLKFEFWAQIRAISF